MSRNNNDTAVAAQVEELLRDAAFEGGKIRALAWAIDLLTMENPDNTLSFLEVQSRIGYLTRALADIADQEVDLLDTIADLVRNQAA